ncbi:MAG TPA: HAD family phosphatase [Solirubrobacterales bacterium]
MAIREIAAVIFDLDGVLLDSETAWVEVKRELTEESGGHWQERARLDMLGMSSLEWSRYMHDELGVPVSPEEISSEVADRVLQRYRERLPLLPGAVEAVTSLARRWPLGLASSSNRSVIDLALEEAGLAGDFTATVSSEEVERGKPAPDVYLEAARRLDVAPGECVAIEDSTNGIRSAHAAKMAVIAVPNADFPPEPDALALADQELDSLERLSLERVSDLARA